MNLTNLRLLSNIEHIFSFPIITGLQLIYARTLNVSWKRDIRPG